MKYLESSNLNKTDEDYIKERKSFVKKKAIMRELMLDYYRNLRRNKVIFPKAVDLLVQIRLDR